MYHRSSESGSNATGCLPTPPAALRGLGPEGVGQVLIGGHMEQVQAQFGIGPASWRLRVLAADIDRKRRRYAAEHGAAGDRIGHDLAQLVRDERQVVHLRLTPARSRSRRTAG